MISNVYRLNNGSSTKITKVKPLFQYRTSPQQQQKVQISMVSSEISAETSNNYPDLEPNNKFWKWVQVPSSCYKSLV